MKRYTIGIIGLGKMGSNYLKTLSENDRWDVVAACDLSDERLSMAEALIPDVKKTKNASDILADPAIDVVGIFTLADARPGLIEQALERGKHIMAEKPIADTIAREKGLLAKIEASDRTVAVNIFNRNAWYHEAIQEFIREGEIGDLAIVNASHQTAGMMPTEGHAPEGPPFHDCGMHYVDVVRWYAGSEFDTWHAQGIRMWDWKDPWWVNAHGQFENGVVFTVTQGFTYGQLAETKVVRCGLDVIGTKGVVRMSHDFSTVRIEFHGVHRTEVREGLYGGKKLEVMAERFAEALDTGDTSRLPSARDSVIASEVSQAMLDAATRQNPPSVGTPEEMAEIIARRTSK